MKDAVIWIDRGWQNAHIGFCPSEKAWVREMKLLGTPEERYPTTAGHCQTFEHRDIRSLHILVTIADEPMTLAQLVGIIAHECMHVWRFVREHMGEKKPSVEFEAYSMQAITQDIFCAYTDTRGLPLRPKRVK